MRYFNQFTAFAFGAICFVGGMHDADAKRRTQNRAMSQVTGDASDPTGPPNIRRERPASHPGVPLFARVSPDRMVELSELAYRGEIPRRTSRPDRRRIQRIMGAIRLHETLFDFEATADDALVIAVQQARGEAMSRFTRAIHPLDVQYISDRELGLAPGIESLGILEYDVPGVMLGHQLEDVIRQQELLLELLNTIHPSDFHDILATLQSDIPGLSQSVCNAIFSAMLYSGGGGGLLDRLYAEYQAWKNGDPTREEMENQAFISAKLADEFEKEAEECKKNDPFEDEELQEQLEEEFEVAYDSKFGEGAHQKEKEKEEHGDDDENTDPTPNPEECFPWPRDFPIQGSLSDMIDMTMEVVQVDQSIRHRVRVLMDW